MPQKSPPRPDEGYAMPPRILREMAYVCAGDKEKIYQRLLKNTIASEDQFRWWILEAWHYLAWSKMDGWKKEKRKTALKELEKIQKAAATLNKSLPKINFSMRNPAGSLEERMYNYLGRDSDTKKYERELACWRTFQENLETQIKIYDEFERFIKKGARNGRYGVLIGLTEFIYQIALLYQQSTGKKFTVDKLARGRDGVLEPVTEGMKFAEKSIAAIFLFSSSMTYRFTPQNFQSACDAVSKRLRKSEKP